MSPKKIFGFIATLHKKTKHYLYLLYYIFGILSNLFLAILLIICEIKRKKSYFYSNFAYITAEKQKYGIQLDVVF